MFDFNKYKVSARRTTGTKVVEVTGGTEERPMTSLDLFKDNFYQSLKKYSNATAALVFWLGNLLRLQHKQLCL